MGREKYAIRSIWTESQRRHGWPSAVEAAFHCLFRPTIGAFWRTIPKSEAARRLFHLGLLFWSGDVLGSPTGPREGNRAE